MKFSIIVPVFNTAEYLPRCIAALEGLDYPRDEYEILFVDNGSTDRSRGILLAVPRIRVLSEPKQGSYAARNAAVREARGAVLAFTDSDCAPHSGWLRAIDAAFADAEAHVVMGPRQPPSRVGVQRLVADYERAKARMVFASPSREAYYGHTNNMAVRRSTMDRYGPFVERSRGSDTIFVRRVVDGEGCRAVVYRDDMCVAHFELVGLMAYYRKVFIYGRSRQLYRHIMRVRPLTGSERLEAARLCIRENRYPWYTSLGLFGALAGGAVAWSLGSLVGRLSKPA